jgi:hypothetical protein
VVILLLILGFVGPWHTSFWQTGAQAYYEFLTMQWLLELFVIIPLVVGALFLVTLVRLFPGKIASSTSTIILERLITAAGAIVVALVMLFLYAGWKANTLGWGLWFSVLGVYLAPINVLVEMRSTLQKGQKWPWWAWFLLISIILPWLGLLLVVLWLK